MVLYFKPFFECGFGPVSWHNIHDIRDLMGAAIYDDNPRYIVDAFSANGSHLRGCIQIHCRDYKKKILPTITKYVHDLGDEYMDL